MIEDIADFGKLEESLKASKLKYRDGIVSHYKNLGEALGFSVRDNAPLVRNAVNLGRIDLAWLEPNVAFAVEFGSLEEAYKHLWKILEMAPSMAVLVLSSKSSCKPEEVNKLIEKSELLQGKREIFLILDLAEKKVVRRPSAPLSRPC